MSPIILYFLQGSRSIRVAWVLEELGIEYKVERYDSSAAFREGSGTIGGAPAIKDGDLTLVESSAIIEYLCEKYDQKNKLMLADPAARAKVRMWMSAAEGTFSVHAFTILYGGFAAPDASEKLQAGQSAIVQRDFDWLESELKLHGGKFIMGDAMTGADAMMSFTVPFILKHGLGTRGKSWPAVEQWIKNMEDNEAYKRAVAKTGHTLN